MSGHIDYIETVGCDTIVDEQIYSMHEVHREYGDTEDMYKWYLREDIIGEKLYKVDFENDTEELIVDYSLDLGDSIYFQGYTHEVMSITQEFQYGKERRVINIYSNIRIVEGVGYFPFGFGSTENNNTTFSFQNVGEYCSGTVSTEETIELSKYKAFPNRTSGYLNIQYSDSNEEVEELILLDVNGRSVYTPNRKWDKGLKLTTLQLGVYILRVNGVKKKIIKL